MQVVWILIHSWFLWGVGINRRPSKATEGNQNWGALLRTFLMLTSLRRKINTKKNLQNWRLWY